MHTESVEIYSDASNAAVMRHPGRRFPGVLIQGDTLHSLCVSADSACAAARGVMSDDDFQSLNELRNQLWALLTHYKSVLDEHKIRLPFSETPAH
jgi:hypothetical protein